MKIKLKEIRIREITKNYINNQEEGAIGYDGKLNIRPPYQREFIYKEKQRNAVIETILKGFPLNVMYWVKNSDGTFKILSHDTYEILDGQQRTISFCEYVEGNFAVNDMFFHNLTKPDQEKILNYKLMIYFCEGNDKEKLEWFETINIAGEKLTPQELKNAIYMGPWVTDAKKKFSKTGCPATKIGKNYLKGSSIRQEYLETVIKWMNNGNVAEYMGKHQYDENANALWEYFQKVIHWVKKTFQDYRREMKGLDWGELYNEFKDKKLDPEKISKEVSNLMEDEEVQKKTGIYFYVLTRKEKYLNLRQFGDKLKREIYEKQNGICPLCKRDNKTKTWNIKEMEADHIIPWSKGGTTTKDNCQMLCKACNRIKTNQ